MRRENTIRPGQLAYLSGMLGRDEKAVKEKVEAMASWDRIMLKRAVRAHMRGGDPDKQLRNVYRIIWRGEREERLAAALKARTRV